jgi:alpha-tubulin suppressor-like RCC1 family protein
MRVAAVSSVLAVGAAFAAQPVGADGNEAPGAPAAFGAITAGARHSCAILDNARVKCWGANFSGALGLGDVESRGSHPGQMGAALPTVDLGPGRTATAVAGIGGYTCALLDNGSVKCWGESDNGELGLGTRRDRGDQPGEMGAALPAVDLGTGRTATAISAGGQHSCALLDNGSVKCWGRNSLGQLGQGDTTNRGDSAIAGHQMGNSLLAVDLGTGAIATAISAGEVHTCAVLNIGAVKGLVKCWGSNGSGQLGQGDTTNRGDSATAGHQMGNSLLAVDLGTDKATAISAGANHTCALLNTGAVKCWGINFNGQLGQGNTTTLGDGPGEMGVLLQTVDLGGGHTATALTAGSSHTCARLDDTSVKCWGSNFSGQLGLGDLQTRGDGPGEMGAALPVVDVGTGSSAIALTAGSFHMCARVQSNAVKCWGAGSFGELGQGDPLAQGDDPEDMGDFLRATSLAAVPGAPTVGALTPGNGSMTVTFAAPADNGGSSITSYTVTASPGGANVSGAGSPLTVTGLPNGVAHTFTVTATNAIGTGPPSAASASLASVFQPDVQARKQSSALFADVNAYSTTATAAANVAANGSVVFVVKVDNDGNVNDQINLKGALAGSSKLSVTFRLGALALPNMTTAGRTFTLAPHATASITVTIKATAGTPVSANRTVTLTARSLTSSTKLDKVNVKATRT